MRILNCQGVFRDFPGAGIGVVRYSLRYADE